jgi:hypothetical protein
MRRLALLPLLALGAGAAQAQPFDARAWLAAATEATGGVDVETVDFDDARIARIKALADTLDAAVGWRAACFSYWDPEAQRVVQEPADAYTDHWSHGMMELFPFGEGEALAAVTCTFGAYQGTHAVVHVAGDRATLLRAQDYDEHGQPYGPPSAVFSTVMAVEPRTRTFATFARWRGLGDCGMYTQYRVGPAGEAETLKVRARDCGDTIPDELPPPQDWPVVFPVR